MLTFNENKKIAASAVLFCLLSAGYSFGDLIAAWDFQTTTTGGTALSAAPNTPRIINANFGTGTIYLDGSNGSSSWTTNIGTVNQLTAFGGTSVNASNGLSTVTSGSSALALVNSNANANAMVIGFSMTGFQGLSLTYSAQRTSTGFTNHLWEYSTDATSWSLVGNIATGTVSGTIGASFAASGVLGLYNITGLDNASTAYLRLTVTGASASGGNNRLDNIQLNATVVPEPAAVSMLLLGLIGARGVMRRRRQT